MHLATHPANELFNLSLSFDDVFEQRKVKEVEETPQYVFELEL